MGWPQGSLGLAKTKVAAWTLGYLSPLLPRFILKAVAFCGSSLHQCVVPSNKMESQPTANDSGTQETRKLELGTPDKEPKARPTLGKDGTERDLFRDPLRMPPVGG